jgi:hypothetical protein
MKAHSLLQGRIWMLAVIGLGLIAGHGVILYYLSSHLALSAGVVVSVILIVGIKHVGLLGPLNALIRRRMGR